VSIRIYFEDFQNLLEKLDRLPLNKGVVAQLNAGSELHLIQSEYHNLVEDCSDWLRTQNEGALAHKLETIAGSNEPYQVNLTFPELVARLTRSIRAIRTYSNLEERNPFLPQKPDDNFSSAAKFELPLSSEKTANKVFVVHGHDESMLHQVMRLLSDLGLEGIVLREQANKGKAIFEKLEYYSNVNFAVILMTADDMGSSNIEASESSYNHRARQNVIMELGFFVGKLQRANVCVLKESGVEAPSDILGIVYVPIDPASAWRLTLGKELREAGFKIDLNKL
jgi:predicted nucleotide-binding protein